MMSFSGVARCDCTAPGLTFPLPTMEQKLSLSNSIQLCWSPLALKQSLQLPVAKATAVSSLF